MPWPDWPTDAAQVQLRVAAGAAGVTAARLAWEGLAGGRPVPPRTAYRVETVLEELLMNVALHGSAEPGALQVDVAIALTDQAVLLALQDEGRPFDPTAAPPAVPATRLQDAPVGGRGLGLVRRAVREWRYARLGDRNCQRLAIAREG